ncbi:hypothetical protein BACPEC_00133 [[Bacteroides] pectinophilus ATCC 43243]|uniref:Uncharacterized protein n=1 Tax=[Bacteroides] pectinophilus ATCC 43243 TaxID=483218 RepID=B7AN81_9FIRM|nr:hypothetical protein BACPEC_00133 [[Bacteroides] pectinophilus ATCC 43243]
MESSMGKKDYGNILTTVIFSIFILAGLWTWENRGFLFGYFPHTSHYELTEGYYDHSVRRSEEAAVIVKKPDGTGNCRGYVAAGIGERIGDTLIVAYSADTRPHVARIKPVISPSWLIAAIAVIIGNITAVYKKYRE